MKFEPITVTLTIRPDNLYDIAQMVIDTLRDDFGDDVVDCAGVDDQELFDAIMLDPTFRHMIVDSVKENGVDVVANPYDYFDGYDFLDGIPGCKRVVQLCKEMDVIMREAKESYDEIGCIPVPKGYKLVKIG